MTRFSNASWQGRWQGGPSCAKKNYQRRGGGVRVAGFQEGKVGVLKQGALADFAVLSKDLFAVPAPEIINVKVVRTVVGGREMYVAR